MGSNRVLRSLMIGDCDHYFSPYIFGVSQGMSRLGHWHSQVSIRQPIEVIAQRVRDVRPDVLWTHMLLWGPPGSAPFDKLLWVVEQEARRGCRVVIHDGDYKDKARYAQDLSRWCAVALCNHAFDRSAWKVPVLHWPYFAFAQDRMNEVPPRSSYGLFFAGTVQSDHVYSARTRLLGEVHARGVNLHVQQPQEGNTLFRTAEIAVSSMAVLGFGRPGVKGWVDTRVFQYPGAGAILLHDEAPQLEPWVHYAPYISSSAESVTDTFARVCALPQAESLALRQRAFAFVQEKHSSVARVKQVLEFLFGKSTLGGG